MRCNKTSTCYWFKCECMTRTEAMDWAVDKLKEDRAQLEKMTDAELEHYLLQFADQDFWTPTIRGVS